jgi:hypothetical protein
VGKAGLGDILLDRSGVGGDGGLRVSRRGRSDRRDSRGFLDKWVPRTIAVLLSLLALVQGLLRYEDMRALLNESLRLEGEPLLRAVAGLGRPAYPWLDTTAEAYGDEEGGPAQGVIYLRLLSEPKGEVWALVNGRAVKRITEDDGVLACQDGDLVEILCDEGEVNVLVTYVSDNLAKPAQGVWVKGSGILHLSRVLAK